MLYSKNIIFKYIKIQNRFITRHFLFNYCITFKESETLELNSRAALIELTKSTWIKNKKPDELRTWYKVLGYVLIGLNVWNTDKISFICVV